MTWSPPPDQMAFMMIVNDTSIARFAHDSGMARLFVDLEHIGKGIRQKGLDTWKIRQTVRDVTGIREAVPEGHLLVCINPLHDDTSSELEDVRARSADSVILPLTRLHIGLNDVHLDMKLDFMFQPLSQGTLEQADQALRSHDIRFGIGGIARAGESIAGPKCLLGEHVCLGSDAAILSRTLHRGASDVQNLQAELDFQAELVNSRLSMLAFASQIRRSLNTTA
jgi:hypothetical protein